MWGRSVANLELWLDLEAIKGAKRLCVTQGGSMRSLTWPTQFLGPSLKGRKWCLSSREVACISWMKAPHYFARLLHACIHIYMNMCKDNNTSWIIKIMVKASLFQGDQHYNPDWPQSLWKPILMTKDNLIILGKISWGAFYRLDDILLCDPYYFIMLAWKNVVSMIGYAIETPYFIFDSSVLPSSNGPLGQAEGHCPSSLVWDSDSHRAGLNRCGSFQYSKELWSVKKDKYRKVPLGIS